MSTTVHLWTNTSKEAKVLQSSLEGCGYNVIKTLSGSACPVASSSGEFVSGYETIKTIFIKNCQTKLK